MVKHLFHSLWAYTAQSSECIDALLYILLRLDTCLDLLLQPGHMPYPVLRCSLHLPRVLSAKRE